jgi:hypothetical protein
LSALTIAAIVVVCCFGAALVGIGSGRVVPSRHLDSESKDTVKLVLGLIATMAALVLSLLIASARSSFEAQQTGLEQLATDIIELDHQLAAFGPETTGIREGIRAALVGWHSRLWSEGGATTNTDPRAMAEYYGATIGSIQSLSPNTDTQQNSRRAALDLAQTIGHTRLLMFVESGGKISPPLLVILILWVSTLFLGFGLFARLNPTVCGALFIGSVCVSAAVFLILELNSPFSELMRVSDGPVRYAISRIGQ